VAGVDTAVLLVARTHLCVSGDHATIDGLSVRYDPADADSLDASYLSVVRVLRDARHDEAVRIRHDDVATIAAARARPRISSWPDSAASRA
jgi:hypothetical protein